MVSLGVASEGRSHAEFFHTLGFLGGKKNSLKNGSDGQN